jgi:hypothetical protein
MKDARLRTPQAVCAESEKPDGPPAERCQIEFPRMTTTAGSGHGPWYLARSKAISIVLSNAYFKSLGLPSLVDEGLA